MSDADKFLASYRKDSCYSTFKGFAEYAGPLIDDYYEVNEFRDALKALQSWQNCCPDGRVLVEQARPQKAVLPSLEQIPVPAVFGADAPCDTSTFTAIWKREYAVERQAHWQDASKSLRDQLHLCCTEQFNACIKKAGQGKPGGAAAEASAQCLRRFDPAHQLKTADPLASDCDSRITAARTVWEKTGPGQTLFPASLASGNSGLELAVWGAAVLVAAFLIGAAGRRNQRLLAGGIGALIAGAVFFGSLMLLPASGRMGLLLAGTTGLLLVTLRSLFRALYLLRHRRTPTP